MDRGQDLRQVKTFLKPISPELIPHPEKTQEAFVRKLAPHTFHHIPAMLCCAVWNVLFSPEPPRDRGQGYELPILLIF